MILKPPELKGEQEPKADIPDHLARVGPDKPLGYVFANDFTDEQRDTIAELLVAQGIKTRGYAERVWVPHHSWQDIIEKAPTTKAKEVYGIMRDAYVGKPLQPLLVAYDETALRQLIDANQITIQASGWPNTVTGFIDGVMHEGVPTRTPLHQLISQAFGDNRFGSDLVNIPPQG